MTLDPPPDEVPTMPKSRLSKLSASKNTALVTKISKGEDAFFARIEANLGPKFRIAIFNTDSKTVFSAFGSPRGLFKRKLHIQANDIVVLSSLPQPNQLCEIIGLLDRQEASDLCKQGRLEKVIFAPLDAEVEDDIFTYEAEEEVDLKSL